jgi:hypothetical protein
MLEENLSRNCSVPAGSPASTKSAASAKLVFLGEGKKHDWLVWQDLNGLAQSISDESLAARQAELTFEDAINIQYTSGTTGFPKGVVLTHHNLVNNALFIGNSMNLSIGIRICIPVPFYHCFGMVLGNLTAVLAGATMVIPSATFDAAHTLRAVEQERCTGALRCSFHVHRGTGAPGVCALPSGHFADRNHGWFALSHRGHEEGCREDALPRHYDRLRPDRIVSCHYTDQCGRFD